jgi:hypothetical protein
MPLGAFWLQRKQASTILSGPSHAKDQVHRRTVNSGSSFRCGSLPTFGGALIGGQLAGHLCPSPLKGLRELPAAALLVEPRVRCA